MTAYFTIDVDCDSAWPLEGQNASVTKGQNHAEFTQSKNGLLSCIELLEELNIQATFFFEARTALEINKTLPLKTILTKHAIACHGLEHENFPLLKKDEIRLRIRQAKQILEKIFGRKIDGFRAPYLEVNLQTLRILNEEGFKWDSSSKVQRSPLPQVHAPKNLYFWPLIEGKISEQDFLERISTAKLPVLSTHSWHFVSTLESKPRTPDLEKRVLQKMLAEGQDFGVLSENFAQS